MAQQQRNTIRYGRKAGCLGIPGNRIDRYAEVEFTIAGVRDPRIMDAANLDAVVRTRCARRNRPGTAGVLRPLPRRSVMFATVR